MQHTAPKQTKLLGATVRGLGTVTAVSSTLFSCYVLIEDERGVRHHRYLADIGKDEVVFPVALQSYTKGIERIGYNCWDEVYSLASESVELEVAA